VLQTALNVIGDVYIPAGSYFLNSTVTLNTGNRIRGAGKNVTRLLNCGSTNHTLLNIFVDDCVIQDLQLNGNCGIGFSCAGIHSTGAGTLIENVECVQFQTNIWLQGGYSKVDFCHLSTARTNGFLLVLNDSTSGSSGYAITDNRLDVGDGNGLLIFPASGRVSGNVFEGSSTSTGAQTGLIIANSSVQSQFALFVEGNHFEGVPNNIALGVGSGANAPKGPIVFTGNMFTYSPTVFGNCAQLVLIGNSFNTPCTVSNAVASLVNLGNNFSSFTNNAKSSYP
jgi:hypothetical protein